MSNQGKAAATMVMTASLALAPGCAGVSLKPDGSPGPEACPAGAKEAMSEFSLSAGGLPPFDAVPVTTSGNDVSANYLYIDGDIEGYLLPEAHMPAGMRLRGKVWTRGPRIMIRYYEAILPGGKIIPFCGQVYESSAHDGNEGLSKKPGPRPGTAFAHQGNLGMVKILDSFK